MAKRICAIGFSLHTELPLQIQIDESNLLITVTRTRIHLPLVGTAIKRELVKNSISHLKATTIGSTAIPTVMDKFTPKADSELRK
jgi:hypothetical protein